MKSVSLLSLLTARGWLPAAPALTVRFESQSSPPFAMEELTRENIANVAKATTPATKASATSRPVPAPSSSGISRSFTLYIHSIHCILQVCAHAHMRMARRVKNSMNRRDA
jgi:hypothetical protein